MLCLNERRTIRQYEETQIPKADLQKIVDATLRAPTAMNVEDINIIVVTNKSKIEEISKISMDSFSPEIKANFEKRIESLGVKDTITCDAPCVMYFYTNERKSEAFSFLHCGLQLMSAMVAAKDLGYDTMTLGVYRRGDVTKIEAALDIPSGSFIIGLAVGKAKPNPKIGPKVVRASAKFIE